MALPGGKTQDTATLVSLELHTTIRPRFRTHLFRGVFQFRLVTELPSLVEITSLSSKLLHTYYGLRTSYPRNA